MFNPHALKQISSGGVNFSPFTEKVNQCNSTIFFNSNMSFKDMTPSLLLLGFFSYHSQFPFEGLKQKITPILNTILYVSSTVRIKKICLKIHILNF